MTDRSADHWYPTAAYLYVLHLDGPALAWEYLRRNPDYRRDWLRRRRRPDAAQAWSLRLLENPALDGVVSRKPRNFRQPINMACLALGR